MSSHGKKQRCGSRRRHGYDGQAGQAMIVATIFFLIVSLTVIYGLATPLVKQMRISTNTFTSRQSYFLAESAVEDTIARLKAGGEVEETETFTLNGLSATVETSDTGEGIEVLVTADINDLIRKVRTEVMLGEGVSFHYGMQSDTGGIILENTASVVGNVYSNGTITGSGPANNFIYGDVISAGPTGLVHNVHATSSVYAHTITDSIIDRDAYFQTIDDTTVGGIQYPGTPDQATSSLPIDDAQIDVWKAEAEAGGVINSPCPYLITSETTIGPVKINCDLEISGNNYTITIAGNIWVKGNIVVKNSPTLTVDPSIGNKGVVVVAHNPDNETSSSKISLENSAIFTGSGQPKSYIFFVSQNDSAENGGNEVAINIQNSVTGDVLVYARHGEISMQNAIQLKEVSAYRIRLKNTAQVRYKTGLVNLLFSQGPSGGYELLDWVEVE